jgi:hypothetical protein
MSIVDFFNPEKLEHVRAYANLMKIGMWPADFIPDDITFPSGWQVMIAMKLADAYVRLINLVFKL